MLRDVAEVIDGLENAKVGGWYQGEPAVVIDIQRQPGANVIDTVQRIKRELPRLQRAMPAGAKLTVVQRPHRDDPRLGARRAVHAGARRSSSWCWWC